MFERRKKNYRTFIYAALIVTVCLLIIALFWPKDAEPRENEVKVSTNTEAEQKDDGGKDDINKGESGGENHDADEQNKDMGDENQTYYLVRKDGENISVYFVDEKGGEVKLETTAILYEFLPPEDQANFEKGVKVNSQEELAVLLQDFES